MTLQCSALHVEQSALAFYHVEPNAAARAFRLDSGISNPCPAHNYSFIASVILAAGAVLLRTSLRIAAALVACLSLHTPSVQVPVASKARHGSSNLPSLERTV
jgi:hypothetical protein